MDPLTIGGIIGGVSSLFGLGKGMASQKPEVDVGDLQGASSDYLNFAKDTYGDPNSAFYQGLRKALFKKLQDNLMAQNRQTFQQQASTGVRLNPSVAKDYQRNAAMSANDQLSDLTAQLFGQGQGFLNQAYGANVNAQGQVSNLKTQANFQENQNKQDMYSGLFQGGMGLLGMYANGNSINGAREASISW